MTTKQNRFELSPNDAYGVCQQQPLSQSGQDPVYEVVTEANHDSKQYVNIQLMASSARGFSHAAMPQGNPTPCTLSAPENIDSSLDRGDSQPTYVEIT